MPNTLGTTPSFYNFIPLSTPSSRRSGRCRFRTDYGTEAGLPGPPRDSPAVGLSRRARRSNEFRWRERDPTEPRCSSGPAPASTADALAVTVRGTTHVAYAGDFRLECPTRAATSFSIPSYRIFDYLVRGLARRLGRPLAGVRSVAPCERSLSVPIGCTQGPRGVDAIPVEPRTVWDEQELRGEYGLAGSPDRCPFRSASVTALFRRDGRRPEPVRSPRR